MLALGSGRRHSSLEIARCRIFNSSSGEVMNANGDCRVIFSNVSRPCLSATRRQERGRCCTNGPDTCGEIDSSVERVALLGFGEKQTKKTDLDSHTDGNRKGREGKGYRNVILRVDFLDERLCGREPVEAVITGDGLGVETFVIFGDTVVCSGLVWGAVG